MLNCIDCVVTMVEFTHIRAIAYY